MLYTASDNKSRVVEIIKYRIEYLKVQRVGRILVPVIVCNSRRDFMIFVHIRLATSSEEAISLSDYENGRKQEVRRTGIVASHLCTGGVIDYHVTHVHWIRVR